SVPPRAQPNCEWPGASPHSGDLVSQRTRSDSQRTLGRVLRLAARVGRRRLGRATEVPLGNRTGLVRLVHGLALSILATCVAPPAGTAWPQRANPSEIRADTRSGPTPQAIVNQNSRFGTLDAGEYFLMAGRRTRLLRVRGMIAVRVSDGTPNPQAVADKLTAPGAALDAFQLKL